MIIKYFSHAISFVSHSSFLVFTSLFPKKKDLWIFGAWEGKNYTDNTKFLYEYLKDKHPEKTYVWETKNIDVFNDLKERHDNVVMFGTLQWFKTMTRAAAAFETEGDTDIGGFRPGRCKIIQLWHGYGGKDCKWYKKDNTLVSIVKSIIFDDRKHACWMVPSEYAIESLKRNFDVEKKQCYLTGSPRNDYIKNPRDSKILTNLKEKYPNCKKIIAYMPTHRNFGRREEVTITDANFSSINDFCMSHHYLFFFKPHFHEMKFYRENNLSFSNIEIADTESCPEYADLYSYLGHFDMLISDYSSVIYDFLCTEKPVILFPYDLEEYKKTDGVPKAYLDDPCGPMCFTWQEVFDCILRMDESDEWKGARERNRQMIHLYNDGRNCERVYSTVLQLINEK